jgi:hypothetical protein
MVLAGSKLAGSGDIFSLTIPKRNKFGLFLLPGK